jgi:hypothetical protein
VADTNGFVPLLVPRDNTELELAKALLDGAEIPFAIGGPDRVELLEDFAGSSAEGLHLLLVPADRHGDAVELFTDAWGPDTFEPWAPPPATTEETEPGVPQFVPLLIPRDTVELELTRGLLEGDGIPYAVGASSRVGMLRVLGDATAVGPQAVLVPADRLEQAVALLKTAWGSDTFEGRDPRP